MTGEELKRLKELVRGQNLLQERLKMLYLSATRTTAILDGLPRNSTLRSKVEESVISIRAAIEELEALLTEVSALRCRLSQALSEAHLTTLEGLVIQLRYSDGQSFKMISKAANLSASRVFNIHRKALNKILHKAEQAGAN